MKRILSSLLATTILLAPAVAAAEDTVNVQINYLKKQFDQPALKMNNRTMVPLRAIFESLGAKIVWDEATQTVTANKGETTITLQINATTATKNGQQVMLDQAATVVNDRTMVPIRFVSESLGAKVLWNEDTQTVNILSIETDLTNAIEAGDITKVKELLSIGVDLNDGHLIGFLPVIKAVWFDQPEILKLLIDHGANVNPKLDPYVKPPLSLAITLANGQGTWGDKVVIPVHTREIVNILLAAKADPNGSDFTGVTPLMSATILDLKDVVQQLIDAGADLNLKDRDNKQTALKWALDWQHQDIIDLLRKAGAKEQ